MSVNPIHESKTATSLVARRWLAIPDNVTSHVIWYVMYYL